MEFLQTLFQQRLQSLAQTFLKLLQQLQINMSPFSEPTLAPHKLQYLEHLIVSSIRDERQRHISRLTQQVKDLRAQLSKKSLTTANLVLNKDHSTSTCSRDSGFEKNNSELCLQMPTMPQQIKRNTQNKHDNYFEQTYLQAESSIYDSLASNKLHKKRKDSQSSSSLRLENVIKNRYDNEETEANQQFDFKYLRLDKRN